VTYFESLCGTEKSGNLEHYLDEASFTEAHDEDNYNHNYYSRSRRNIVGLSIEHGDFTNEQLAKHTAEFSAAESGAKERFAGGRAAEGPW
jgi:hypothetical protein